MHSALYTQLQQLSEPEYAAFQRKIVTDTAYPILGVRMAALRKLAKQYAFADLPPEKCTCYEQIMISGLALCYAKLPFSQKEEPLRRLLPYLDSWALTDSLVPTLRLREVELPAAWDFAMECLYSPGEFTRRFGIVMLLRYFLERPYSQAVVAAVTALRDDRYYVRMAVAWLLAELAVTEYALVENILKRGELDPFTHNMTIRKMRESYRITKEQKAASALLRRK